MIAEVAPIATLAAGEFSLTTVLLNVLLMFALLALSGAFSGSEAVLFSLTPAQLERNAASPNPLRRLVARMMKDPKPVLLNILLLNTAVNVLLFANAYVLFNELTAHFGAWIAPVAGVATILLVVVFGEVTPKVLAVALAERVAPYAAALVHFTGYVGAPLARLIDAALAEPFVRVAFGRASRPPEDAPTLSTAELKALLDVSRTDGAIDPLETMYLREVIDLRDVTIHEVMVARVDMVAYDVDADPQGLRELMRRTRLKKVPVYEGAIDNIVGLVYAKILFFEPDKPLRELVSPVRFVPDLINAEQLLQHFRATKSQIAIAVDEFGGVTGLVTLEDVIEQIVGEIRRPDELPDEPDVRQISDTEYEVNARLSVRYWAETFGLDDVSDRVSTVGGLVAARLGRTVQPGHVVRVGNLELTVVRVAGRRPERIRLRLLPFGDDGSGPAPDPEHSVARDGAGSVRTERGAS